MDRFFHERLSSKPLGLFRLLWGVFLVFYLIDGWWLMHLYSGAEGLRYQGWMPEGRYTNGFWSLFQWASNGSPWFELVYGAALLSAVAMALGWWVRVTSVVAWVCLNSLITPLAWGFAGVDFIVSIMTFLMMVASLGGAFGALVCFAAGILRRWDGSGVDLSSVPSAVMFHLFFQWFMESDFGCMAEWDGHAFCTGLDGFIVAR